MPLHTIMTTGNTVASANPAFSPGAASVTATVNATSMIVTATANMIVPNGSPVRWATTSAWYTAANTVAIRTAPVVAATAPPGGVKTLTSSMTQASAGQVHDHHRAF